MAHAEVFLAGEFFGKGKPPVMNDAYLTTSVHAPLSTCLCACVCFLCIYSYS